MFLVHICPFFFSFIMLLVLFVLTVIVYLYDNYIVVNALCVVCVRVCLCEFKYVCIYDFVHVCHVCTRIILNL